MKNNWITILLTSCLLLITVSVVTYFLYLLPKQNDRELLFEKMKWEEEQNNIKEANIIDEENKQKEIFRKECVSQKDKNIKDYEDFINSCTKIEGNSIDYCIDTPASKAFSKIVNDEFVATCIEEKLNLFK